MPGQFDFMEACRRTQVGIRWSTVTEILDPPSPLEADKVKFQENHGAEVRDHIAEGLTKLRLKRICEDLCQRPDRVWCDKCGGDTMRVESYQLWPTDVPDPLPKVSFIVACTRCSHSVGLHLGQKELLAATAITIVNLQ